MKEREISVHAETAERLEAAIGAVESARGRLEALDDAPLPADATPGDRESRAASVATLRGRVDDGMRVIAECQRVFAAESVGVGWAPLGVAGGESGDAALPPLPYGDAPAWVLVGPSGENVVLRSIAAVEGGGFAWKIRPADMSLDAELRDATSEEIDEAMRNVDAGYAAAIGYVAGRNSAAAPPLSDDEQRIMAELEAEEQRQNGASSQQQGGVSGSTGPTDRGVDGGQA